MTKKIIVNSIIAISILTLIIWAISCAVNPVTGKKEFMLLSETGEAELGKQTDAEVVQTYGLYTDQNLTNYVNTMGQKMGKVSHRPQLPYNFKVLDTPVINAFAVPGGYVYLTRGILAYLNNQAELAGVIGHEIGHVSARHTAQQYSKAQAAQLGLGLGAAFSETFRKYAGITQFGVSMFFLKFSRDNERQADALGVEYSLKAGYDADEMANFFVTLERLNPSSGQSGLPEWFSTHPNPPDRIKAIKNDVQKWKTQITTKQFAVNRDQYLNTVNGIMFGDDPRQGYVEGNMFYHPQLRIQFPVPAQWQLNNTPSQVQMYTEKQDAVILFSMSSEGAPKTAADQFVSSSNAVVKKSEATRINGLSAYRVVSDLTSEGSTISITSYFIQKDGKIFVLHGYTSPDQYGTYEPTFTKTMTQFKTLTDNNKINVKPSRLSVKKVTRQADLKTILSQFGVEQDKLEDVAIMNGKNLDDIIPVNTLLKVVTK